MGSSGRLRGPEVAQEGGSLSPAGRPSGWRCQPRALSQPHPGRGRGTPLASRLLRAPRERPLRNKSPPAPGGAPPGMWGYLALLPIGLAVWAIVGVWTMYAGGAGPGRVSAGGAGDPVSFPASSLCGSFPPQSCIFGQLLNVGAVMVAWICVLRYLQLREWGVPKGPNRLCLGLGFLCALGASFVGNFQQSNELSMHLFGAFLAFVVGVAYFWTQLVLLRQAKPEAQPGAPWIETLRLLLCGGCTFLMVAMVVLHLRSLRSAAAVCEWSISMLLFILFGLLAVDFSHLSGLVLSLQTRPTSCPPSTASLASF
ncbi:modulator of macroautophagy TMEM150B isoform X3 [Gracilinanus agilis]|uniref:modulator of macroautophagy TMEM150B isoform X3 n=1 Tax=Gracilinanus agilis TaxID=191870 RepID=UPI001CFC6892|nr:modulator of macroautophagy TMEM150B isoform X3 [Gracilinanus agilis]